MWPEVTGAEKDGLNFVLCCWGGRGSFPHLSEGKAHKHSHMCTQLLQRGHMREILTDATVFFVSSIFC